MPGITEYLDACVERRRFLSDQLNWFETERTRFDASASGIQSKLEQSKQELVGYLLPDLTTPFLAELQNKIRFGGLLPIKKEFDERFRASEARRETLQNSDAIQFFDLHHHQAEQKVLELKPAYESAMNRKKRWEGSRWFRGLSARGFFEIDSETSWWNWFWNWRDVSFLMRELERNGEIYSSPQQVKEAYRMFRDQDAEKIDIYQKRLAEYDELLSLKKEFDSLQSAPERIFAELFRALGDAVLNHFLDCPEELRREIASSDPILDAFFRKETGMSKQVLYLNELNVARVQKTRDQIRQEIDKLDAKIAKLKMKRLRNKRTNYSVQDIQSMRETDPTKWEKRRAAISDSRTRIDEFDQYHHGSFLSDYLWWDLITRGMHGDDIFEVRQFHQSHPNWDRRSYVDPTHPQNNAAIPDRNSSGLGTPLDGAANALAASMTTPSGDLFSDAS